MHPTAGTPALVCTPVVVKRQGFLASVQPLHSPVLTMIGTCILGVSWFGFNGGSALVAGSSASMASMVTKITAATASLVWMFIEWFRYGGPSLVEIVAGMVAGLATVTLASGFIAVQGGLILGIASGAACYIAVDLIRMRLRVDNSLDVFAVHGVGGIVGNLLVVWLTLAAFGGVDLFCWRKRKQSVFSPALVGWHHRFMDGHW